jgi:hypothetical protein
MRPDGTHDGADTTADTASRRRLDVVCENLAAFGFSRWIPAGAMASQNFGIHQCAACSGRDSPQARLPLSVHLFGLKPGFQINDVRI